MRKALLLLFSINLTACSEPIDVGQSSVLSQNETARELQLWTANRRSASYTVDVFRNCENCAWPADFFPDYRITTNGLNQVILIQSLDSNGDPDGNLPSNPSYYLNIEDIFERISREISSGRTVVGTFDSSLNYPSNLEFGTSESWTIQVVDIF